MNEEAIANSLYAERTIPELPVLTGVSETVWRERIATNPIIAKAFYPAKVGSNRLVTCMFRLQKAYDEIAYEHTKRLSRA